MEKRRKQQLTMKSLFQKYLAILGILVGSGIIFILLITTVYLYQGYIGLIYAMLIGTSLFSILIVIATIAYYRRIRNTYFEEMFSKTLYNYEMLSTQRKKLVKYKENDIKEFEDLNNFIDVMNSTYKNITLATKKVDYSDFDLEYINDTDKHLISAKSFQTNIRSFILSSECFRDAVLVFNIEEKPENITDKDYQSVIDNINKFIPIEDKIYAISYKRSAILVFVPNIDSISFFEEAMNSIIKESVICDYHPTGVNIVKTRAAMVVYPYSNIDSIIEDLRYADRQGKRVNIYLPERLNNHNDMFVHNTLLLNNMTKVYLEFNKIIMTTKDNKDAIKKGVHLMKNVRVNLNFENVGSIMREDVSKEYFCTYNDCDDEENRIFTANNVVNKDFIMALEEVADSDGSYYFSFRNRASDKIGKYLDTYGIRSGHFFLIRYNGYVKGVIYFANKNKDLYMTNYAREMLFVFCTYLGSFTKEIQDKKTITMAYERLKDVLRLSDIDLYTIEKSTHKLAFVSDALADVLGGNIKHGGLCYKEIYGLDAPCENCPLATSRKMNSVIRNVNCITTNVLSRRRTPYTTMVLTHGVNEGANTNRFHNDLLIFSGYSLADKLNSLYAANIRGSMVLISIDNVDELVEQYNDEGYFLRVRNFITELKNGLKIRADIYAYSDDMLAVLFNEEGQVDVVGNCEKMFDISQSLRLPSTGIYKINPTFIVFDFPKDYPNVVEFERHVVRYVKSHKDSFNDNRIVIAGQRYSRPASRDAFILNALHEAFKKNALHSKIFPIIGDNDKTIIGAEILLRLSDEYLNVAIPTTQFIEVARKNGLIFKISNYLIDYLGKMYQQYGVTTFKISGLRCFSINTEISFFQDENFLNSIGEFMQTYHLPKGFLVFEITESDIAQNYEFYKSIYKRILSYDITLACDNYSGRDLSIAKLRDIGIQHIKVARWLVSKIDTDVKVFNEVGEIISDCYEQNCKVCLVGIENTQQHKLLGEYEHKCDRQGYLYGEPMELDEFINKLKGNVK